MGSKNNSSGNRERNPVSIFILLDLCCFFYLLGAWQKSGFGKGNSIALEITKQTDCNIFPNLDFEPKVPYLLNLLSQKPKYISHVMFATPIILLVSNRKELWPSKGRIWYTEKDIVPPKKKSWDVLFQHPGDIWLNSPGQKATTMSTMLIFLIKAWHMGRPSSRVTFSNFQVLGQCSLKVQMHILMNLHQWFRLKDGSLRTALDTGCGIWYIFFIHLFLLKYFISFFIQLMIAPPSIVITKICDSQLVCLHSLIDLNFFCNFKLITLDAHYVHWLAYS